MGPLRRGRIIRAGISSAAGRVKSRMLAIAAVLDGTSRRIPAWLRVLWRIPDRVIQGHQRPAQAQIGYLLASSLLKKPSSGPAVDDSM